MLARSVASIGYAKVFAVSVLSIILLSSFVGMYAISPVGKVGASPTTYTLTEWTIPTSNSIPTGLSLDPSGNCCWFVEETGNNVAHFDPASNSFQEWQIPTSSSNPTGLATTTISGSLAIWGTEFNTGKIFFFSPATGVFNEYPLAPGTQPEYISIEPPQTLTRVWFNEFPNKKGEIKYDPSVPSGSAVAVYEGDPFPPAVGGATNGLFAVSGAVYFAGAQALVKWDRVGQQYTIWPLPAHGSAQGDFLSIDNLGQVWYTQGVQGASGADNYVGVLRGDNTIKEWQIPTVGADPRVIALNPLNQVPWITEYSSMAHNGKIAVLDPSGGGAVTASITPTVVAAGLANTMSTPVVSAPISPSVGSATPTSNPTSGTVNGQFTEWSLAPGGPGAHDIVVDSSGNAWILENSLNKIARLSSTTPDFTISASPPSLSMNQGLGATATVTIGSTNGFNSAVDLSASWVGTAPSNVVFSLPTPVTPPPGSTATSNLMVTTSLTATTGTFTLRITASSGPLSHYIDVPVQVLAASTTSTTVASTTVSTTVAPSPDFSINSSPVSLSVASGGAVTSTIIVNSLNGFNSPVSLSYSWVGTAPSGVSITLPGPITPPSGSTATSTLTVSTSTGASTGSFTLAVTGSSGPSTHAVNVGVTIGAKCLIATATYGSEVAPEVQVLRNFRDESLMKTHAGSGFMIAFNTWYYSFSPTAAAYVSSHSAERTVMKGVLYPMIGILYLTSKIFSITSGMPEVATLLSGLFASLLIGAIYLGLPLTVVRTKVRRLRGDRSQKSIVRILGVTLLVALGILVVGEFLVSSMLLIVATSGVALSVLFLSAVITSSVISKRLALEYGASNLN